jgi:Zn-dependent protease with chaperone function
VSGAAIVLAVCVPSYLRLEPVTGSEEEVGLVCSSLALCGIVSILLPVVRVARRVIRTESQLRGLDAPANRVCVLENGSARMALAGLFEWRLLVSRDIMEALSPEELAVAMRHEHAHQLFKDNFARAL